MRLSQEKPAAVTAGKRVVAFLRRILAIPEAGS